MRAKKEEKGMVGLILQARCEPKREGGHRVIVTSAAPSTIILVREEKHCFAQCHRGGHKSKNGGGRAANDVLQVYVVKADDRFNCVQKRYVKVFSTNWNRRPPCYNSP